MDIFYRQGNMFKIDMDALPASARHTDIINGLYAAVYQEFKGAVDTKRYGSISPIERFNKLNEFASNWLKQRGLR